MTSTGINIGLDDGGRSSSRVLRPPGGGHTDIFGGGEDVSKVRQYHGRNASSIMEGTNSHKESEGNQVKVSPSEPAPVIKNDPPAPVIKNDPPAPVIKNDHPAPESRASAPSVPQAKVNNDPPAPQSRVRVPPGGFSSGLW